MAPNNMHITARPVTLKNWYKHVDWLNVTFIFGVPLVGLIATRWVPLTWLTLVWSIVYYFATGLGITAGYHRLWSHTSYSATLPLRVFLALAGAASVEGSIRWWSRGHRAHHRYTDTEKDPYSVRKGLIYSHVGWLVMKQDPKRAGRTDISDLDADPVVVWQRRYYIPLVAITAWVFPSLVAALCWGDWLGGLVYAGVLRMFFVQQATFCVNSIAHYLGDQPFDDRHSPRDHFITALLTLGEGWHNFHHEFLSDWRNGIHWHQYDPTKRAIFVFKAMGLAHDLKAFPSNEIKKGQVQQAQKKLDRQRAGLDWGVPLY